MNLNLCQKEQEQINNWLSLEGNFITYKGNNGFPSFEPLKKGIPEFLLYKGKEVNLSETKIAIVGTRRPDYEALQEAFRFGYECALNNLTVVSGFAEGIDQSAMRGALRGGGKVIGILACGHEIEYPSYTLRLREEILENCGTIVS
ncbi:MAG: DNA-processing protein DprA, partial [Sphaerochaetaceae bacterium]|nr:DNA-processing protein DprA [Sphaerochaetaceae bacterium]